MSNPPRPDDAFESALASGLRSRRSRSGGDTCPSPELLGAYWDETLSAAERSTLESHLADCPRCQAHVAALAQTDEPSSSVAAPVTGWSWLDWWWLAPAATLAVIVLAIWVIDPSQPAPYGPQDTMSERAASDLTPRDQPAGERFSDPATADPQERPNAETTRPSETEAVAREPVDTPASAPEEIRDATQETRARRESSSTPTETDAVAPVMERAANQSSLAGARSDDQRDLRQDEDELNEVAMERQLAPVAVAEQDAAAATAGLLSNVDRSIQIASPDGEALWRLSEGVAIEWSTDNGRTWITQLTDPSAQLVTGSAPSVDECWVVGREGVIYRTTNGSSWERVRGPTSADLVEVTAESGQSATVTAVGGEQFVTRDGGQTWQVP